MRFLILAILAICSLYSTPNTIEAGHHHKSKAVATYRNGKHISRASVGRKAYYSGGYSAVRSACSGGSCR